MMDTNVELSKNELELVSSSEVILTKNRIIEKVYALFGSLSEEYRNMLHVHSDHLPAEIFEKAPKIYKGEQYLGLPYVMMDYPRSFAKENVFAIRSFFWWGNYFSITLHISGSYLKMYSEKITLQLKDRKNENWFLSVHDSAWEHHFEEDNYLPLGNDPGAILIDLINRPFLKIAKKIPLADWINARDFYMKNYNELLEIMR